MAGKMGICACKGLAGNIREGMFRGKLSGFDDNDDYVSPV